MEQTSLVAVASGCRSADWQFSFHPSPVRDITDKNFGLLIAYVIPGFVALWGVSYHSTVVAAWLSPSPQLPAGIEAVFFVGVASIAVGMTASAFRWAFLDTLFHFTGLQRPQWDDSRLPERLDAFDTIVEAHYKFYQCYSNSCIALAFTYAASMLNDRSPVPHPTLWTAAFVAIEIVFLGMSRDALRKYYARSARLLGTVSRAERRGNDGQWESPQTPSATDEACTQRHEAR